MKLLGAFVFLVGALPAWAGLTGALTASVENTNHGRELIFRGTLTNTSTTDKLFLNDINPNLDRLADANLTFNANSFFSNVPGILMPNESYTDSELFRLVLEGDAPAGDFVGTVTFNGGVDIFASDELAAVSCHVLVPMTANGSSISWFGLDTVVYSSLRHSNTNGWLTIVSDDLDISFFPDTVTTGLTYFVEASSELGNWSSVNVEDISASEPDSPALRRYRYQAPLTDGSGAFLRLRVEQSAGRRKSAFKLTP